LDSTTDVLVECENISIKSLSCLTRDDVLVRKFRTLKILIDNDEKLGELCIARLVELGYNLEIADFDNIESWFRAGWLFTWIDGTIDTYHRGISPNNCELKSCQTTTLPELMEFSPNDVIIDDDVFDAKEFGRLKMVLKNLETCMDLISEIKTLTDFIDVEQESVMLLDQYREVREEIANIQVTL
jgi:hypothetical protein